MLNQLELSVFRRMPGNKEHVELDFPNIGPEKGTMDDCIAYCALYLGLDMSVLK